MMSSRLLVLGAAFIRGGSCLGSCQYGALVSSHLIEASAVYVDGSVAVRARLGDTAYLAEGLQCLEGGRASLTGIQWQILNPLRYEQQNCTGAPVFSPNSEYPLQGGAHSVPGYHCTPEVYAVNPWVCAPGDLSGKFGPLDLGLHDLLGELKRYRFLAIDLPQVTVNSATAASSNDFDGGEPSKLTNALSQTRVNEEIRMYEDKLPIPDCQLDGKLIGFYCADGRLAGCGRFESIISDTLRYNHPWEAVVRFFAQNPPLPVPPVPKCPNDAKVIHTNKTLADPGWSEKIGKEIGKVPDYVSGWWEDVKRKSRDAWKAQA